MFYSEHILQKIEILFFVRFLFIFMLLFFTMNAYGQYFPDGRTALCNVCICFLENATNLRNFQ